VPLQGEAKRAHHKEYMRRRRAEQRAAEDEAVHCSFCGKTTDEVHTMITAPAEAPHPAFICDVCAGNAYHTCAERRRFGSTAND
jgi:ClpX C4-type zinc finger